MPKLHSLNFPLKGKHVFSRLDLLKGSYQVLVNRLVAKKNAIITSFGTFQFNFMPFGLMDQFVWNCRAYLQEGGELLKLIHQAIQDEQLRSCPVINSS